MMQSLGEMPILISRAFVVQFFLFFYAAWHSFIKTLNYKYNQATIFSGKSYLEYIRAKAFEGSITMRIHL